jgi:hypothetical protein
MQNASRSSSSGEDPIAFTCSSNWDPKCRNRRPNSAGRPTARRLRIAAHKNSDQGNETGRAAIRSLLPRDNAAPLADQPGGRHRQLGQPKKLTEQKARQAPSQRCFSSLCPPVQSNSAKILFSTCNMSLSNSRGRAPQRTRIAAFEQRGRSVVTDLEFLWYVSYFEQRAQQIMIGPMNIVMLLTDGFGGFGGIAKFNRDFMHALDAC